jgi:hypothetical protein
MRIVELAVISKSRSLMGLPIRCRILAPRVANILSDYSVYSSQTSPVEHSSPLTLLACPLNSQALMSVGWLFPNERKRSVRMKKFALLAVAVVALCVAVDAAQAGVFRRSGGGCPGGVCGVAAAPAYAPKMVTNAPPAPAKEPTVAAPPAEAAPVVETTTQTGPRYARTRGLFRRRG